jgi:hypothetical protein
MSKTTTLLIALALFGCASDQKDPNEPDTSKETGEAVEAVGEEVEEEVNQGADAVEDATDD